MIGETAAADCGNYAPGVTMDKALWIASLFAEMAVDVRPGVRAFFWFNENKKTEADWRITSCNAPRGEAGLPGRRRQQQVCDAAVSRPA